MTEERESLGTDDQGSASDKAAELAAFSSIVSALNPLRHKDRVRLFRTIATFFDLTLDEGFSSHGTGRHPTVRSESPAPHVGQTVPPSTSFSEDRAPTPKAFLLEKKPQTDVERIACLAYYLTHYREQTGFKTLDLSKLNTEAAQIKFTNAAKAVDNATQAHFLIQAGQGKKQISAIGELYVQALPDRAAARQAAAEVRKKRAKARPRSPGKTLAGSAIDLGVEGESDGGGENGPN